MKSRLDPIITPGKVSGHVHIFMGTSRVAANLDTQAAMAGTVSLLLQIETGEEGACA
jgi:predicted amidohydrolase